MLANSNLSLISPKSNVNSSSVGGETSTSTDSFDSVFQQVSGELSSDTSSQVVPITDASVSSDAVAAKVVVSGDTTPTIDGDSSAINSDLNKLDTGLVAIEQENISNLTGEASSGTQGMLSDGVLSPALPVMSQNTASQVSELDTKPSEIGEPSVDGLSNELSASAAEEVESVDTTLMSSGLAGSAASSELVTAQKGLGNVSISEPQVGVGELNSQEVTSGLGGNSLQSQGVNLASLNSIEQASVDTTSLASNEKASLKVGAITTDPLLDTRSSLQRDSSEMMSSELVSVNEIESKDIVIQTVASDVGSVDVTAGLALLGTETLSRESESQAASVSNKLAASNAEVITPELEKNANLDWIMQQMSGEKQATADVGLMPESIKPQSSVSTINSVLPQSTDSLAKQTAPLSLGLVAAESGLLEVGPESELLVEAEVKGSNLNKIEPELGRQLDSSSMTRSGLGDSLSTSAINTTQTAATDVKLGLAATVTNTSNPANMTMQVPPNHPNWSFEMGEKMMWMNKQGIQQAEIHLDPPELGSLTVKVSVDSDVATVSFVAASTQVKDLLEGQVQRLREMMAQQGVELTEVDVNVSQQGSGSHQSDEETNNQFAQNELESEEVDSALMTNEARVSRSKVDFYA
ncbi:flagellar hook-length control protein FliK [Marinomonas sp. PE14-40]|uniref:flagellar hook-length control protein FliK n=1 Tax=Marinomonas sp. PE14-40 TaxID=3060621 RepID=UPI003F66CE03